MNIFYLSKNTSTCAEYHLDKHCVKMILEYSQLLSTAHRVLDGTINVGLSDKGRKRTTYQLSDDRNDILYSATHINHPSAIWVRKNNVNYSWLQNLLVELCKEYTYRYGKVHKCEATGLVKALERTPNNIATGDFTEPTPAMPDEYKVPGDSIQSYKNYYNGSKSHMFAWKNRTIPEFINKSIIND